MCSHVGAEQTNCTSCDTPVWVKEEVYAFPEVQRGVQGQVHSPLRVRQAAGKACSQQGS